MIYKRFHTSYIQGKKSLALLIDPDCAELDYLRALKSQIDRCQVDFLFIGGSLVKKDQIDRTLKFLNQNLDIPTIIFPGDAMQINDRADGILFLSLISGRNPDLLIGQHVKAAPYLRRSKLEVIPTGYILIDGGQPTSVSYMSQTMPIPRNKPDIAASTASAGELLGLKVIYLDAGSGARYPVGPALVAKVREETNLPLIVGGGIRNSGQVRDICQAGADILVVGTAVEDDPERLTEISGAVQSYNQVHVLS